NIWRAGAIIRCACGSWSCSNDGINSMRVALTLLRPPPCDKLNRQFSDMCGIAGKFNFDATQPIDQERLAAMTTAVTHRGPDSAGYYVGSGIGFGFRRLSIIDLATGNQPLSNEDQTIWVIFNGEIYNFAGLREELESAGHQFR